MKRLCSSLLLAAGLSALPHTWADDAPVWTYTETKGTWRGDKGAWQTLEGTITDENWTFTVASEGNGDCFKVSGYLAGSGVLDMSTLPKFSDYSWAFARLYMDTCDNLTNENGVKFQEVVTKVVFPPFLGATTWGGSSMVPGRQPNWFNCNSESKYPNLAEADFSLCGELKEIPAMFTAKHPTLTTLRLPESVATVKRVAFTAPNLTAIYWQGAAPEINTDSPFRQGVTNFVLRANAQSWADLCDPDYPLAEGQVGRLKGEIVGKESGVNRKVYVTFADEGGFALTLEDWTGPYDGEPHGPVFSVNPNDATVTWAVGESQEYSDEMPTLTEVGELTVRARAEKEGEEPIEKTAKITVTKAENSWVVEPSLSELSWKVGTEAPTLNLGQSKFGVVSANYTQATLPTAVGSYVLEVTVPASGNWTALTKSIPFAITDKPIWTFTSTGSLQGTITDGNWKFEVNNTNGGDTRWNLKTYLAGAGVLDMSTLERWSGCSWMYMDSVNDGEGVADKFENVVSKVIFPSFLGAQVWGGSSMVPGRQPGWFNCQGGVQFPNVKEADFSLCEELIELPQFFTKNHPALTTIRLPAVLDSVKDQAFNGNVLTEIYWMGEPPESMATAAYKWDSQTNFVLRAYAESWAAKCVEDEPLAEKKIGRLSSDYVGTHSAYGKTFENLIYVVFTPFKETKKGLMIFIR